MIISRRHLPSPSLFLCQASSWASRVSKEFKKRIRRPGGELGGAASLAHSNMTERQTCKRCYDDNVDTILEKAPTIILSLSEVIVCKDLDDNATLLMKMLIQYLRRQPLPCCLYLKLLSAKIYTDEALSAFL